MQETQVRSLYWEDPLEEGKATHSSILAWRIPMDRGTWWATVRGVANMTKQLSTAQQSFKIKKSLLKYSLQLDRDCTESVDCFGQYGHFDNVDSSNP